MKFVFSQMFDVRPRTYTGALDLERIRRIRATLDLRGIPPTQPTLPHLVRVLMEEPKRYPATLTIRRRGALHQPVVTTDITRTAPAPSNLPIAADEAREIFLPSLESEVPKIEYRFSQPEEEPLVIPKPRWRPTALSSMKLGASSAGPVGTNRFSFSIALFFAMLLVPAMASLGSALALERTLTVRVADAATALEDAASAMASLDAERAEDRFAEAYGQFRDARTQLSRTGFGLLSLLAELPVSARLSTGDAMLEGGEQLAQAGESLSGALRALDTFAPEALLTGVLTPPGNDVPASAKLAEDGERFEISLLAAAGHLDAAAKALDRIRLDAIPLKHRAQVERLRAGIPLMRTVVESLTQHAHALSGILGMREVRRYVVLLQNTSELRPTGGFAGNIAVLTVSQGRLLNLAIEDTYHLDGQITRYTVPPKPLQDVSAAWSLHDANWYRDFPTSARIASRFYEHTGGATPDGVFAVSSPVLEALLVVTGPLTTNEGVVFRSETVTDQLNALGAVQRPGETTQLRAMAELLPLILTATTTPGADTQVLRETIVRAAGGGDLQLWFRDQEEQALAETLGLSGSLPEAFSGDVLAVVHTNINGFKSEKVLGETVSHDTFVRADGTIDVETTITRHHHGDATSEDFYRQVSKSWTRILVPKGATLLAASGFTCKPDAPLYALDYETLGYRVEESVRASESTFAFDGDTCVSTGEENGYTVFAGWLFTSPGETAEIRLRYRLPFTLEAPADSYRLLVLKQPGFVSAFSSTVVVDPAWTIAWQDDQYRNVLETLSAPPSPLTSNRFFGAVFTKE